MWTSSLPLPPCPDSSPLADLRLPQRLSLNHMQMARLESERKSERGEREREEERQTERQMSNRGLLSLEQEAGLKQTVHPSKLHISPLTGRVRLSVSSPSPFAGPWHPFTLGSTGSTPPSALPLPFPSVRARVGRGSKASPLSLHSTGRKETAALICRPSSTLQPRVCLFSKVRPSKAAKFMSIV